MLNEAQFKIVWLLACFTVSVLPFWVSDACPEVTNPLIGVELPVPTLYELQVPAAHGTGSRVAGPAASVNTEAVSIKAPAVPSERRPGAWDLRIPTI